MAVIIHGIPSHKVLYDICHTSHFYQKQGSFGKLSSERNKYALYVDESGYAHAEVRG